MKVAMLDPSLFTPPYDSALCLALQDYGIDLTLYTREVRPNDFPLRSRVNADKRFYRLSEYLWRRKLPGRLVVKAIEHVFNMASFCRQLEKNPPDVIHAQWFPLPAVDNWFLPRLRKIAPVILTVHDTQIFHGQASSRFQAAGWRRLLSAVDHLVVHLPTTRATLTGWGISSDRISVVEHGIFEWSDDAEQVDRSGSESVAGLSSAQSDKVQVLFFGRIGEYKGLDLLVNAVARLSEDTRSKMRLSIVGPAAFDIESIIADAQKTMKDDLFVRIEFVPEGDLQAYLKAADIVVFPYREIDSSGALMTAMAQSTAILASDLATFRDVLEPADCAEFFETGSDGSLSEQLSKLLTNADRRQELRANLNNARGNELSWPAIATKTVALYESLMRRPQ